MKEDKTKELPTLKGPLPSDRTMKIRMPEDDDAGSARGSGREADRRADADEMTERGTSTTAPTLPEAWMRVRMSSHDAHYGGNLVDGARMLALFGDIATELLIRHDGDEGLFRAYESVEFLAPVRAGDYIEAVGRIIKVGKTSRQMSFEAWKVITPLPDVSDSAAELLREPVLVCRAVGTCVTPADKQRKK